MSVQSQDTTKAVARVKTEDFLPSFNMIYQMHKNMNMRFAYSTTLARPTFREISTFTSYDFNGGDTYIGNPDLKRTLINNFDLRWEWFFNPGEIVALSLFSKRFKNPIEVVITDAVNKEVSWENADRADVMGLEFELRKKLSMFSNSLKDFTLGGNISLISSQVDIVKDTTVVYETDKKSTRSFQGQSPYILNLFVNYANYKHGISSALYYNVFGKRLAAVGSLGVPDVYEEPFHLVNFNISKQLFDNWKVKLAANNLLNWNVKKTQEYKNRSYTYSQYNRGISFTVGISYTL